MTHFTDQEIIDIILKREERSTNAVVEELYRQNKKVIAQYIYLKGGNEMDADDMFQDLISIFLNKVWRGTFILRDDTKISTYFYAMAKNRWMKKSQSHNSANERNHKYWESGTREIPEEPDALRQLIEEEDIVRSLTIFNKLEEKDRNILKAFFRDKLSMEEIAKKFGFTNAAAAKTRKYRAIEKLRGLMGI